jgi:phage terminase large subunit-like protein
MLPPIRGPVSRTASVKDYDGIAEQYARDVVDGRILACRWVKLACARQLRDLERQGSDDFPYTYTPSAGARYCRAIELLPHIKGKWAGTLIVLEPWQIFGLMAVFSWLGADGTEREGLRRFRTTYEEVPRKNAKSTKTSGVGICMTVLDGEGGAECYSAATSRDQAKIVWADARQMVLRSPGFRNRFGVEVGAHAITVPESASKFVALSSEDGTLDGLNIHFAAVDELHAHKTRGLYDVLETATGARTQSLLWNITTAGSNKAGICYELRTYAAKVLEGVTVDETFYGIMYTIDEGDDPFAESSWRKANPNYGVSVMPDDIERLANKAKETPAALNNFLTKRLNVWVNADTAWMPAGAWEKCADRALSIGQFEHQPCYAGADLATKDDLASLGFVFPRMVDGKPHYYVFTRNYLPEAAVERSGNSQYSGWARERRIIVTGENSTDYDTIQDDLRADKEQYAIQAVAYDPFQAHQFATQLFAEGFPMIEVGATVKNFSEPMKEFAAAVVDGRLHHDGDPLLAWAVSNVVCHTDAKENIYPRKALPQNKIDPVVALLMAFNRALLAPVEQDTGWLLEMAWES